MSSKIEISRYLADKLASEYLSTRNAAMYVLRGILAAHVVERQPDAWLFTGEDGEPDATCRWDVAKHVFSDVKPLFTALPELAELQATIAQLESKLNNALNLDFERRETIAQQTAEIERLKSENDEPEWHQMMTKLEDQNTELRTEIERLKLVEEVWNLQKHMPTAVIECLDKIDQLERSAMPMIVHPDFACSEPDLNDPHGLYEQGFNDCIRKYKELNYGK